MYVNKHILHTYEVWYKWRRIIHICSLEFMSTQFSSSRSILQVGMTVVIVVGAHVYIYPHSKEIFNENLIYPYIEGFTQNSIYLLACVCFRVRTRFLSFGWHEKWAQGSHFICTIFLCIYIYIFHLVFLLHTLLLFRYVHHFNQFHFWFLLFTRTNAHWN